MAFAGIAHASGDFALAAASRASDTAVVASKVAWEQKWDALLAEAKKEGVVRMYAAWSADTRKGISDAFKNRYGIVVEWQSFGRGDEITPRLSAEQNAGLYVADAVGMGMNTIYGSLKTVVALRPLLSLLVLPEVTNPKVWRIGRIPLYEKEGYGIGLLSNAQRFIVRNTDLVKDGEVTSYKDLLKPQFKGKIIMDDPQINGAGSDMMSLLAREIWNEEEAIQFLRELIVKQEVALNRNNRLQVEATARGKYAIAIASRGEIVNEFTRSGAPLALVPVREGVSIVSATSGFALPEKAPHPNAAAVMCNWLLSKEGQTVVSKGFSLPSARVDVTGEGLDPLRFALPGEKVFGESAATSGFTGKMIRRNIEMIKSLAK